MKNRINVAELLMECPEGMELDCVMFDKPVKYLGLTKSGTYMITIKTSFGKIFSLTKEGFLYDTADSRCIIFPKGKTTWEGFVPPCEFKDGDILATDLGSVFYLNTRLNTDEYYGCYVGIGDDDSFHICAPFAYKECCGLATEEEKTRLFQVIKDNGYKWNAETKTLDNLIEPKFKVGDRVKQISSPRSYIIRSVEFDRYILHNNQFIRFKDEHIYELVSNKFDINTLIPFESKVLVRHNKDNKWTGSFFSFIDRDLHSHCYKFVTTADKSYPMMIPFKGNEYLLGKTDDCQDFYKIWES